MTLQWTPLTPRIGAQLHTTAAELLDGSHAQQIRDLLVERGVVIARGIGFDDEQQRAFTRTLGDLRVGRAKGRGDESGLLKVSMDRQVNPEYAEYFAGTFFWHIDGTYEAIPPFATVLSPRVLPPDGGQTEFANTYAAYEDLQEDEQRHLETLQAVHTMVATMYPAVPDARIEDFKVWMDYPQPTYPIVWQHKSGRKSLVLSTSVSHVLGVHPVDSRALLEGLMAHATADEYVYRHSWQLGDVLIWDNTGTMHRARPYDPDCDRVLHRFTLKGEEPIAAVTG
ncbi:TauD/TfdA dioxygenase family protein [Mycolicibacterium septicum]|uniref:TauD/TfdA dioxygenase family protein n=1 Tax=Mycolicibacterium septicum TaxID=98668 RepID=UPI00235E9B79|nr:TauD/TfdA family dioxygenase [Mycolicibacterium septicum]